MELPAHPILALVELKKNGLKAKLTSYIDATVEREFATLRNTVVEMIQSGQIDDLQQGDVTSFDQTLPQTAQTNSDQSSASCLNECDQLTVTQEPQNTLQYDDPLVNIIKQEFDDDDDDEEDEEGEDCGDDDGEEIDEDNVARCDNCEKGICDSVRENCDNTRLFETQHNDHSSLENNQPIILNDILLSATHVNPITLEPVIKQEYLQGSPIQLDFNGDNDSTALNDIAINKPSNSIISSPNDGQNAEPITTDDEFDDDVDSLLDDDDGKHIEDYLNDSDCEDCFNGVCELDHEADNNHLNNEVATDGDDINSDIEDNRDESQLQLDNSATNSNTQMNITNDEEENGERSVIKRKGKQSNLSLSVPVRSSGRKRKQTKAFGVVLWNGIYPKPNAKPASPSDQSNSVKKVKRQNVEESGDVDESNDNGNDNQEEEANNRIVTLKLDCTEPDCGQTVASRPLWIEHMLNVHHKNPYHQLESNVQQLNHGAQNEYLCNTMCFDQKRCQVVCPSQDSLKQHWNQHHQPGKFKCPLCLIVANFGHEIRNHLIASHDKNTYICTRQDCGKMYADIGAFKRHQRNHTRPYKCSWKKCLSRFKQLNNAVQHVRVKHFNLPESKREQQMRNIIDSRDPHDYIKKIEHLL